MTMNNHLPSLSPDRIDQMIHLALSHNQDTVPLSFGQRLAQALHLTSRRFVVGLSASAVTASCIAAFWLIPGTLTTPVQEKAPRYLGVSEYIMNDFLEDIT